jgi:hypothetical protein
VHTDPVVVVVLPKRDNQATAQVALVVTEEAETAQHGRAMVNHMLAVVVAEPTTVTHGTESNQAAMAAVVLAEPKDRTVKTDLQTAVAVVADVVTVQETNQRAAEAVLLLLDI